MNILTTKGSNYEIFRKFVSGTLDKMIETNHISEGKQKICTVDKTNSTINYRFQITNHLGSSCIELDENGNIISFEEYHPFGTTSYRSGRSETEVSLKRYKYVMKELDNETGLYYYGMRYYAPWLARFISIDPLQTKYLYKTPYDYAENNPVSGIDLDGLEFLMANQLGAWLNAGYEQAGLTSEQASETMQITGRMGIKAVEVSVIAVLMFAQPEIGIPMAVTYVTGAPALPAPQVWAEVGVSVVAEEEAISANNLLAGSRNATGISENIMNTSSIKNTNAVITASPTSEDGIFFKNVIQKIDKNTSDLYPEDCTIIAENVPKSMIKGNIEYPDLVPTELPSNVLEYAKKFGVTKENIIEAVGPENLIETLNSYSKAGENWIIGYDIISDGEPHVFNFYKAQNGEIMIGEGQYPFQDLFTQEDFINNFGVDTEFQVFKFKQ